MGGFVNGGIAKKNGGKFMKDSKVFSRFLLCLNIIGVHLFTRKNANYRELLSGCFVGGGAWF